MRWRDDPSARRRKRKKPRPKVNLRHGALEAPVTHLSVGQCRRNPSCSFTRCALIIPTPPRSCKGDFLEFVRNGRCAPVTPPFFNRQMPHSGRCVASARWYAMHTGRTPDRRSACILRGPEGPAPLWPTTAPAFFCPPVFLPPRFSVSPGVVGQGPLASSHPWLPLEPSSPRCLCSLAIMLPPAGDPREPLPACVRGNRTAGGAERPQGRCAGPGRNRGAGEPGISVFGFPLAPSGSPGTHGRVETGHQCARPRGRGLATSRGVARGSSRLNIGGATGARPSHL